MVEPPVPVVFTPNPVGDLVIVNDEERGVRLLLTVSPATEGIMLFGQAPCSAGRMKHRRVCYLSLLGPAINGQCDITAQYTARFGQPSPGQKIFVVTCQEKNGWKAQDHVASAIVPPRPLPEGPQITQETKVQTAGTTRMPKSRPALVQASFSAPRAVYKGGTPDARGLHNLPKREHPLSILCTPLVHGARMALAKLKRLEMAGVRLWRTYSPSSPAVNC